jgi:hypothetical protein
VRPFSLADRLLLAVLCVPIGAALVMLNDRVRRRRLPWLRGTRALTWRGALGWGVAAGVGAFVAVSLAR